MPARVSHFVAALLLCAATSWGQSGPTILTTSPLTNGTVGVDYFLPLAASGGMQPYFWFVLSGSLPAGLTLSQKGSITGVPLTAGTATFVVLVKDITSL